VLAGIVVAYLLLLIVSAYLINPKKTYDQDSRYYRFLLYSATACMMKLLRIHVTVKGESLFPKEGRFLLVCNHRSKFDPILSWYLFRKQQLAFISKPENFKVPIFGRIIRRCCFLPIDRENPRNAIQTINRAADLLKRDVVSVAVYPEGTRSKDKTLLPFHNGTLKIAQKANLPIVVAVVQGTETIAKNYPLHRSYVTIELLSVIPAETVVSERTSVLGDEIHLQMQNKLTEGEEKDGRI
jgi:1-acyl-sn-glycerol-3-phosphate acyltransferase